MPRRRERERAVSKGGVGVGVGVAVAGRVGSYGDPALGGGILTPRLPSLPCGGIPPSPFIATCDVIIIAPSPVPVPIPISVPRPPGVGRLGRGRNEFTGGLRG